MPDPRPHGPARHTIPRFHLGRWATGRKKRHALLWQYDKVTDGIQQASVGQASVQPDFYTVRGSDGPTSEIDEVLGHMENRGAPLVHSLVGRPLGPLIMGDDDRRTMALYIAFLNRRVPSAVRDFASAMETLQAQRVIDRLDDADGFFAWWTNRGHGQDRAVAEQTRLRWREHFRTGGKLVADGPIGLAGLGAAPMEAAEALLGRWTILKRTRHPLALIADVAVNLMTTFPSSTPIVAGGPEEKRWHIPLAPTTLLLITTVVGPEEIIDADLPNPEAAPSLHSTVPSVLRRDQIRFHNLITWRKAERYVWARDRSDLEPVAGGLPERERREAGSELHKRTGFFRPDDPTHLRLILDQAARRTAQRLAQGTPPIETS